MARPAGFEPAASRLGTVRSIQLSYGRIVKVRTIVAYSTLRNELSTSFDPK